MKLLSKTTIAYFFVSLLAFGIAAAALTYLFSEHLNEEQNEQLLGKQALVSNVFRQIGRDGLTGIQDLEIVEIGAPLKGKPAFGIAEIWEEDEDERKLVQATTLEWGQEFDGKPYRLRLFAEQLETEESLEFLLLASLPFVLLLAAFTTIGMRIFSAKAWRPFHQNLKAMAQFSPSQSEAILLEDSNTEEFRQLREILLQTTEKVRADYQNLKKFTENASHELQTPIAIAQSQIEASIQAENFGPAQFAKLEAALKALQRVQKINAQLLLLSKIENAQFQEKAQVDMTALIQSQISEVEELAKIKGREIQLTASKPLFLQINPVLAEILTGNLLRNCLNHSQAEGAIRVELDKNGLLFSNPGIHPLPQEMIFQRFYKADSQKQGTGLGLAIVAEICKLESLEIQYFFQESRHFFWLRPKIQN